jgi:phosphoadenosine phosphosulfate reductase
MNTITKTKTAIKHKVTDKDLRTLNRKYKKLSPEERIREIYSDFDNILLTSSFGTSAVFQLHLFYKQNIKQKVHFINTSYHFNETLRYKVELTKLFELVVEDIVPDNILNKLSRNAELWKSDPDQCIRTNVAASIKLSPLKK